jgi:hypothetical protein
LREGLRTAGAGRRRHGRRWRRLVLRDRGRERVQARRLLRSAAAKLGLVAHERGEFPLHRR